MLKKFLPAVFMAVALLMLARLMAPRAGASPSIVTFIVNSTADVTDAAPGNGSCDTGGGVCTLRAAIQEANAHPDADIIQLQPNMTYQLTQIAQDGYITSGLIITSPVTILGAGLNSTIIDGNASALHARVFNITSTVIISGVTIQHGFSSNMAGGIFNSGRLTIINSAILSNTANGLNDWGGGIWNAGPMTLTNSLIRGNIAGSHNSYGGGLYNQSALMVIDSTISDNTISGSPGEGGGLFTIGYTTTIMNSTISGNHANVGGGIYRSGYPLFIINSTISGNYSNGDGGGLYAAAGTTSLFNTTIADNQANADNSGSGYGGGVYNGSGTLNFRNTLIADNEVVIHSIPYPTLDLDDCSGTITSQGYNMVYTVPYYCTVNGSYTLASPLLGPLQNNGGRTSTQALLKGSPAIDAGESPACTDLLGAPITTDQRGVPRPTTGGCDIGAYEYRWLTYLPLVKK